MTVYSFKSVGTTVATNTAQQLATTPVPVGIITPLRLGNADIWATNLVLEDQIADNLRNLILTNHGERLGKYDFGGNLKELTAEVVSQDNFDTEAMGRIKSAVQKWMPYVNLLNFESVIDHLSNGSTAKINLYVTYDIPSLQSKTRRIQVILSVI